MAQQDYAGLLTGLDTRPRNPMQGLDREGRMAQRATGFANRMAGGMLQAAGQDPRTPQQQANAAIGSLNLETDDPAEQQANIEAVRKVDATRAQMLAAMYDKRNKENAKTVATASDRDRRFTLQEDTLKLAQDKAATDKKLAEDTAASNLVLRQSYLDIAIADGDSRLAKLIASGMPLEKIQDEMFKGSNAVVKALTSDERESFDTLMESPVFEALAETVKEPSNYFSYVGNFSDELETVIYQRAKQLKQASGMSDAQALKRALEETATNFPTKDNGGGGGGSSRKSSRDKTGGNVPEAVEGSGDMFSGTKGTKGA